MESVVVLARQSVNGMRLGDVAVRRRTLLVDRLIERGVLELVDTAAPDPVEADAWWGDPT